jgi:hypothetical protein
MQGPSFVEHERSIVNLLPSGGRFFEKEKFFVYTHQSRRLKREFNLK